MEENIAKSNQISKNTEKYNTLKDKISSTGKKHREFMNQFGNTATCIEHENHFSKKAFYM